MERVVRNIHGFVDIVGETQRRAIHGIVDIEDPEALSVQPKIINKGNPISAITGKINKTINETQGTKIQASSVKVTFIKDDIIDNNSDRQDNGSRVIVDYSATDEEGKYVVFLKPGVYTVRIDTGSATHSFTNQNITEGLHEEYYSYISKDGLIEKKFKDVIKFYGIDKKQISGVLLDQYQKPISNAEIIISNKEEVIVYVKTDEYGRYRFLLDNGEYDIRIRGEKYPVKIGKINFKDGEGFIDCLKANSIFNNLNWIKTEIIKGV